MADVAKNLAKIILGIILIIIAVWVIVSYKSWLAATWSLIQGGIIIGVILVGIALLILGFSDIKG